MVGSVTGMGMVCVLLLSGREARHFLFRQSCGDLNGAEVMSGLFQVQANL